MNKEEEQAQRLLLGHWNRVVSFGTGLHSKVDEAGDKRHEAEGRWGSWVRAGYVERKVPAGLGGGPARGGGRTVCPRVSDCGLASQRMAGLPLLQAHEAGLICLFILLRQNPHNVKLIMLKETIWWHLVPSQYCATNIVV